MRVPILMPQLGESIAEATIRDVKIEIGQSVDADEDILEVETEKAMMEVTTPCPGQILEIIAKIDTSYPVGAILGYIEASEEYVQKSIPIEEPDDLSEQKSENLTNKKAENNDLANPSVTPTIEGLPVPAKATGARYISPRLRARMEDLGLNAADLAGIAGSGAGGRITVEDFESFMYDLETKKTSPASSMRIAVADSMRRSWSRPLATVGSPVKLDSLLNHRKQSNPKPGPTIYAIRALAIALGEKTASRSEEHTSELQSQD